MLNLDHPVIRDALFEGLFGLEKESLRIDENGYMALTPHPFTEPEIVTDFCENQIEINTRPFDSVEACWLSMLEITRAIQCELKARNELLWPFSSPAYIRSEEEIPAAWTRKSESDRKYRSYLASRYGKYKMTFSGIHFNFSFSERLLKAACSDRQEPDYRRFVDGFYLDLAAKCACYGWLISVLTNASPIVDGSYYEKGLIDSACFTGMASVRNSELGYWNFFTPIFDYSSIEAYTGTIEDLCRRKMIIAPSELYYPVRLKPNGPYTMEGLREKGVERIELRMLDLNPFEEAGLSLDDARFCHLFLVWLACLPKMEPGSELQILDAQNFKSASHYDLKTARIVGMDEISVTVWHAAWNQLGRMEDFYKGVKPEVLPLLKKQKDKLRHPNQYRYAWRFRSLFQKDFVPRGLNLARAYQEKALKKSMDDSWDFSDAKAWEMSQNNSRCQ